MSPRWLQLPFRRQLPPPDKRLSKDAVTSLFIHFFFQFGSSMSGVFMNLYLWRLTESLTINGIYNIINFCCGPFGFAIGGWLAKKRDRMVTYRVGLALVALFYLVVIIVREGLVDYYPLFAIFAGLGGGFYWVGYLTLTYDVSTEKNRIRYMGFNTIFFTTAGLIGPALAGFVIAHSSGLSGYIAIFASSFVMFFIAALGSMRIKAHSSRSKRYYLHLGRLIMDRNQDWVRGLFGFLVLGLMQGIMLFLPNILLYRALPREDTIGYLGVVFSGVTICMGFYLSKYAREERRTIYFLLAAVGYIIASGFLLFDINLYTVICYLIVYNLFAPMQGNALSTYYYGIMARLPLKNQFRIEAMVIREYFLNAGRVISIAVLIFVAGDLANLPLALILLAAGTVQLLIVLLTRKKPQLLQNFHDTQYNK
ncbi:MFS transporter [Gorillibacterium massiliense]|uniref:MFS transporter n=1 Tax=Gorillibacterium massiliense TaxID=1280390 RepID=UPI0012DE9CF2|nr:MFS transporter [Gorillibacterium massiliense]